MFFRIQNLSKLTLEVLNTSHKTRLSRRYINNAIKTMEKVTPSERLTSLVRPVNYKILLEPDVVGGRKFRGNVVVTVTVKEKLPYLCLHSNLLEIIDVKVHNHDKVVVPVSEFKLVPKVEQLMVNFSEPINKGVYNINVDFKGDLSGFVGLYAAHTKENRIMVASKFQPTYARQAFPCFDEPEYKATFDITLVKPSNLIALSNMNEVSRAIDSTSNTEAVTFATSVPMSTYLACFVICDFSYKETEIQANGIGKNFILRTYGQKDKLHKIDFALDIGKRATEFYIQYYKVPYPLPKLDMIAIPDYISGATEHWGLITYREVAFLVDNATASVRNLLSVANTIAHELAHMWFGNLVTVKWWDDLWLNEGFATYMQTKALNAIEPSWTMSDQFLTKTMHSILASDAKLSSRPIVSDVNTPDEITSIFDGVSYNKGSSILRMLEGFIGEENFRKGISDYLVKYEFGSTVTRDLLSSLAPYFAKDTPDMNLMYIMDTWTKQMGYPLVTVTPGKENNTFILTQKRFLIDPKARSKDDSPFKYRWFIPVTYKTNKGVSEKIVWFPDTVSEVKLTVPEGTTWLKINNNQVGYYRTNYPIEMWENLARQLHNKSKDLTISDRAHLINEVFALAHAQIVPYDLALQVCSYLKVEEDFVPWEAAGSAFTFLHSKLRNTPAFDDFLKFVQNLVEPIYKKQSWDETPPSIMERLIRAKILGLAVKFELPDAKQKVRELFVKWHTNYGTPDAITIEPDLRDFVYYYGMTQSSQKEWDKFWEIYLKEDDALESSRLRSGLGAPRDSEILKKYLSLAWDENNVRSQDYLNVIHLIAENPFGTELVWDDVRNRWLELVDRFTINNRYLGQALAGITSSFNTDGKLKEVRHGTSWDDVRNRWLELVDRFTINNRYLGQALAGITSSFNTDGKIKEMEAFFKKYPDAGAGANARRHALENVRNNIEWVAKNQPVVIQWLKAHVQ